MAEEVSIDDVHYLSSKKAASLTEYSQDYIGQLARAGHINAKRIGGLWYVEMESLQSYKKKPRTRTPKAKDPKSVSTIEPPRKPDVSVSFDGKDYISAKRASEITGYNHDYVAQLARSGKILSRQVGKHWYVEHQGLLAHKKEKDSLLAAVQSEALGISKEKVIQKSPTDTHPLMLYSRDENKDLWPKMDDHAREVKPIPVRVEDMADDTIETPTKVAFIEKKATLGGAIVNLRQPQPADDKRLIPKHVFKEANSQVFAKKQPKSALPVVAGVLLIVLIMILGVIQFKKQEMQRFVENESAYLPALSMSKLLNTGFIERIEDILMPPLTYTRQ